MATLAALLSILVIVISFLCGFLCVYAISSLQLEDKKRYLEEVVSLVINFIIYLWIGKIIWNFSTFMKDPLAVLAYPSHSYAFYIACLLITLNMIILMKRKSIQLTTLLYMFITSFLVATFMYDFIHMVILQKGGSWQFLSLIIVLIVVWVYLEGKASYQTILFTLLFGVTIGILVLTIVLPVMTVFGFMLSSLFYICLLLVWIGLYIAYRKKIVT